MKRRMFVDAQGELKGKQYEIKIKGSGGELGINNVKHVVSEIRDVEKMERAEDIVLHLHIITGYLACCVNCGFLTDESAKEIIDIATIIAEERIGELSGH